MTTRESRPDDQRRAAPKIDDAPPTSTSIEGNPSDHVPDWLRARVDEHRQRREKQRAGRAELQQNRDRGLEVRQVDKVRRMPAVELAALLKDAMNWRRLVDWERSQQDAWTYVSEVQEARRITSVEWCREPDCGDQVELVHPLPRWCVALLPDLNWVRCDRHREAA